MPKISGFDFLKQLREDKNTRNTPVIVVTASTDEENFNEIMRLGAVDYVQKPIDLKYIVDKVESVLQEKV